MITLLCALALSTTAPGAPHRYASPSGNFGKADTAVFEDDREANWRSLRGSRETRLESPCQKREHDSRAGGRRVYRSPDGSLLATVVSIKSRYSYCIDPSRIEIRDHTHRLIAERNHSTWPGLTVDRAGWTKDSRFFVYITENSGGHSPWHQPTFFYSRQRHQFYSLDEALRALGNGDGCVTGWLKLRAPCTVVATARYYGPSKRGLRVLDREHPDRDPTVAINLKWLETRLAPSAVSSDETDKKADAEEKRQEALLNGHFCSPRR